MDKKYFISAGVGAGFGLATFLLVDIIKNKKKNKAEEPKVTFIAQPDRPACEECPYFGTGECVATTSLVYDEETGEITEVPAAMQDEVEAANKIAEELQYRNPPIDDVHKLVFNPHWVSVNDVYDAQAYDDYNWVDVLYYKGDDQACWRKPYRERIDDYETVIGLEWLDHIDKHTNRLGTEYLDVLGEHTFFVFSVDDEQQIVYRIFLVEDYYDVDDRFVSDDEDLDLEKIENDGGLD